jgi:hypothetical protein
MRLEQIPTEAELTKNPESIDKLLEEFNADELEMLKSSPGDMEEINETEKEQKPSNIKKTFLAISAGLALLAATSPVFGAEKPMTNLTEEQKIDLQIKNLEVAKQQLAVERGEKEYKERIELRQKQIDYFNIDGLTVGQPKDRIRGLRLVEEYGIYYNSQHLDDVKMIGRDFDEREFLLAVDNVIKKNGLKNLNSKKQNDEKVRYLFELNIAPEAQKFMDKYNIRINNNRIYVGKVLLEPYFDENTKKVDIKKISEKMIVMSVIDQDGKEEAINFFDSGKDLTITVIIP